MAKQSVRLTNASVVAGLNNKVDLDYNNALVTSTNTNTPRHLSDRFSDIINVKDFGAIGDGIHDDTAAIQSTLNAGAMTSKMVFFPTGTYIIGSELIVTNTAPLSILADNATLKLVCTNSIAKMFHINPSADVRIEGLSLDVNRNAYTGLSIRKDDKTVIADLNLVRVRIENVYRAGTVFSGGDGIAIIGEFRNVRIFSPVIRNCVMATDAGILGSQGIFGITVSRLSSGGTAGEASDYVYIENPFIENVYCEDSTYIHDQDGIRLFTNYKFAEGTAINPDTVTCTGGVFKNIRGRAIKVQSHSAYIDGAVIIYENDPMGFKGIISNKHTLDLQVGGGNISNVSLFANGYIAQNFIDMRVENEYEVDTVHAAGNISNIRAIITDITQDAIDEHGIGFIHATDDRVVGTVPLAVNVTNVTVATKTGINLKYLIAGNARHAGQYLNINAANIVGAASSLLTMVGAGNSQNSVVNVENTNQLGIIFSGNATHICHQAITSDTSNSPTLINKRTIINNKGSLSPDTLIAIDTLVVTRNGNAAILIVGEGDNVGTLKMGTQNNPSFCRLIPSLEAQGLMIQFNMEQTDTSTSAHVFTPTTIRPYYDNNVSLGEGSKRWNQIYAATDTINTSDAREKTSVSDPNESLMKAWGKVNFKTFQFIDAIEKKGSEEARIHFGVIAQQVQEAFASEGLDASKYALFCYDKWNDEYEDVEVIDAEATYDENGNELTPQISHTEKKLITSAGDRYGIRYSEALALECAYHRWRLNKLEEKLNNL